MERIVRLCCKSCADTRPNHRAAKAERGLVCSFCASFIGEATCAVLTTAPGVH